MKKILALILALVMALGVCACGAQTETTTTETTTAEPTKTETTTTETKTEETEETEGEPEMLQASAVVFSSIGFPPKDDTPMEEYYRNYGLDLEILPVDTGTDESWNMFWASGGYADIILPYNYKTELITEEIARPIKFEWIKEYMPRLYSGLLKVFGSEEAIISELQINGEVYCIPYYTDTARVGWAAAIRNDWLEAVGLEVPTTVEEYGEVLRAFTEEDPDGNGIDDTYGADSIQYGLWNISAAYGTCNTLSFWSNDGEVTSNAVADNYRDYLRTVAKWYQNGWLDPEGITDDRGAIRSKFSVGKMGVYCDNPWWFEEGRTENGPLQMLCGNNPDIDFSTGFSFVAGIENVETGEPTILSLYSSICAQCAVYFGQECPDEVIIRYMEMMDDSVVLYDGTEEDKAARIELATRNWGYEGTHWERDEDGYPVITTPTTAEERQAEGFEFFSSHLALVNYETFIGRSDEFVIDVYESCLIPNKVYRNSNITLPVLNGDMADTKTLISDYFSTCQSAFITGEMDIEADWDTYVATMEEYGLSELIAYYQENT